ncbi:hypothetical protein [Psychromonas ossibalaenae]|uniref:hypothetical protein n=1 Tax=Psychromonas ossibalaenae TaxID=444922 RepID=UPI000363AEB7|nr:hypothetical protein [Psychromonas ossibalaenae]
MKKNSASESSSTKAISNIVKKIHTSSPLKDSVYEEAAAYFAQLPEIEESLAALHQDLTTAQQNLSANRKSENVKKLKSKVEQNLKKIKVFESQQDEERLSRLRKLKSICDEILSFCIGQNRDDTDKKIAKLLGTLSLRAPEGINPALQYNQQSQHLYQAVLSLKLLDQLLEDNKIANEYILKWILPDDTEELLSFGAEVQIPLLMTSLLHDVGLCHPAAQQILKGESGDADEFRVLSADERLDLLKCNYQQTLNYLTDGLGLDKYIGGSKAEREIFNQKEKEKLAFIRLLLKSSLNPKQGIGNLIKVPQIYTSVVLSTKRNFTYASLPKVFQVLNKGVEGGSINKQVVETLLKITGIFPQGYGIAYIPKNSKGYDLERYEFAIVNTLYPQEPYSPICRIATRNQVFISSGGDLNIAPVNNLYFADARKKLTKISPERLKGILSKLWSNFEERHEELDLIPKCWHPYEFFSFAKRQNMWNKVL